MRYRTLTGSAKALFMAFTWAGIGITIYHIFRLRIADYVMVDLGFWAILVAMFLPPVFLVLPATKSAPRDTVPWYDYCLAGLSILGPAFVFIFAIDILTTIWPVQPPLPLMILGLITWGTILEGVRRSTGWILTAVIGVFSVYPLFASHLPSLLFAKSYSLQRLTGYHFFSTESVFGIPIQVLGSILIGFMVFGVALEVTGASEFLLGLAQALVGRFRGAPALMAVVASAMFGTMSGSPVANVVTDGTITISAMKKMGYEPDMAGAIEASASTGGALMPPVMGSAAFLMAAFLQIPYGYVCIAAAIPSVLFYLSLFAQVYLHAQRRQFPVLSASEIPSLIKVLKEGWFYLFSLVALTYFLFWVRVEAWAPYYATVFLAACAFTRKETRPNLGTISRFTISVGQVLTLLAPALAGIGMIMGAFSLTGLAQSLGMELVVLAHGNLYLLLLLGAITAFILGMGMPMIAVFIFTSIVFAPALINMGIPAMAANLFLLYWAMLSFITPPVCIAVYAASAIAGSDMMQTGWKACRISIVGFFVPFAFVLDPALVAYGSSPAIILSTVAAMAGALLIATSMEGYLVGMGKLPMVPRLFFFSSGILLFFPGQITKAAGALLGAIVILIYLGRRAFVSRLVAAAIGKVDGNKQV